jgi:hypothetical protein
MIDPIEKLALMASLTEEVCGLSHGPEGEEAKAVDYIMQGLGIVEGEGVQKVEDRIVIPVCADCAEALRSDTWVLLYCLGCNSSQWVLKQLARREYKTNLMWLGDCPECRETEKTNKRISNYWNEVFDVET